MRGTLVLVAVVTLGAGAAGAQNRPPCRIGVDKGCRVAQKPAQPPKEPPTINIGPMTLAGTVRGAMLLQFLERADEELSRATLERKSFVPALVRSLDDEKL